MNTCWKCGRELPEGQTGECAEQCPTSKGQSPKSSWPSDADIKEALRRQEAATFTVDWDKIQSIEDVRTFLRACYGDRIYFPLGVPDSVKPFLKSKEGK